MNLNEKALNLHAELKGKIETKAKIPLTKQNLPLVYTPGVAAPSIAIAKNKSDAWKYTIKQNTVAVVSDGTAVLGLGDIGPEAALPVMEGKCYLFKELAGLDAFPICLDTKDPDEIIKTVRYISPVFGGINLEDISAPNCFEIEARLQDIGIPVMHDDQHGTGIVVLGALINATKVANKNIEDVNILILGAGAAGIGASRLLIEAGIKNLCVADSKGLIYKGRKENMNKHKEEIAQKTNPHRWKGSFKEMMHYFDVFIGVSGQAGAINADDVRKMKERAIVFALSNPTPEVDPLHAKQGGAFIIGTGRSDFPNQINNSLAFPGVFRGSIDAHAPKITTEMKLAAAYALAGSVKNPTPDNFVPDTLSRENVKNIAYAVKKAAEQHNIAN